MYHKWQSCDVWFLWYGMWQTKIFCHFGPFFFHFYPPNNLKNQNFKKQKKTSGDNIVLHMYTINDYHMMYCSWDTKRDGQNFLSFWPFFALLPPTTQKIKILKNWEKYLEISSFYKSVPKIMIICYSAPEIWRVTDVIISHFGPFFALLPPPP